MKNIKFILSIFLIIIISNSNGQTLDDKIPPYFNTTFNKNGNYNQITCTFTTDVVIKRDTTISGEKDAIYELDSKVKNLTNWDAITTKGVYCSVLSVGKSISKSETKNCFLKIDYSGDDEVYLIYKGEPIIKDKKFLVQDSTFKDTKLGFGKGKAIELNAERIVDQKALYSFDYDFKVNIMEYYFNLFHSRNLWINSFLINLHSNGSFGSDDELRNGTQTSMELGFVPYCFIKGLIYRSSFTGGYQLETKMNSSKDKIFDIINSSPKFSLNLEIPLSNYPMYLVHKINHYFRMAMPLTLNLNYFPEGKDDSGNVTLSRIDFKMQYELAFSPYLIIKGEYGTTKFYDVPIGADDKAKYYTLEIGQDLDATKSVLGFLKFILGGDEKIRNKHFIFFRLTNGKKPPAFQDVIERSFGLATYF